LDRTSLIDNIVEEIKGKIITGELNDGEMLCSQDELAKSMGVSRASLREALNRLSIMGLIETRQGSGTFVKTLKPIDFISSLSSLLVMDQASAAELLEARLHIESVVAEVSAKSITEEVLKKIKYVLDGMATNYASGDLESFVVKDVYFHMLVAEGSKNRVLVTIVQIMRDVLRQFVKKVVTTLPRSMSGAIEYHRNIYDAFKRHDSKAARRHMEDHIKFLIKINDEDIDW